MDVELGFPAWEPPAWRSLRRGRSGEPCDRGHASLRLGVLGVSRQRMKPYRHVVRDIAGQPMPGVSVMALPASGGTITSAKTGPDGRYQIDGLAPATYRVDFDLRGFDRVRRNRVADVLLPNHPAWPLIVSDSGFQTRRIQASRAHVVPMVIRLEPGDIQNVPETETFERGCLCPVLFTHQGR